MGGRVEIRGEEGLLLDVVSVLQKFLVHCLQVEHLGNGFMESFLDMFEELGHVDEGLGQAHLLGRGHLFRGASELLEEVKGELDGVPLRGRKAAPQLLIHDI